MTFTYGDYTCDTIDDYSVSIYATDKTKTSYSAIPNSVTYNGRSYSVTDMSFCFQLCNNMTTAPAIPNSVTNLFYCFSFSHLTTAPTIPNSVTNMNSAFRGTDITTPPTIPNSVTNMEMCFALCENLTTAPVIPSSVTNMRGCLARCPITVPPSIPSSVTNIEECFRGCTSLTTAPTIPSNVTSLLYTFRDCTSLTTAPTIPSNITNMRGAFWGTGLTTAPTIPSSVTNMRSTFNSCTSLTTAPVIPSSAVDVQYCFEGCTGLTGNIIVNSTPTSATEMFIGTVSPIYIVNGGNAGASTWKTIASEYANVHYEADDNPPPTINSFNVTRVASSGSTTPSATGTWAYVEALISIYNTYLPVGWSAGLKSRTLTDNSVVTSPTWQPSPITSYPVTTYCWVDIDDLARHDFAFSIADTITSEGVEKASKTSATITALITKAYALVDYYHDDNTGTEGMAIGKLAEDADLLDVAVPTFFREDVTVTDANNIIRALFDFMHPVGSYYETSDTSFDPNVTWGGTWQLEAEGQVHISAGANYTVSGALTDTTDGGEATHILTPSETATKNHSHTINHDHGFTNPTISSNTSGTHILGCPSAISRTTLKNGSGTGYSVFYGTSAITRDGAKATGGAVQQHTGSSGGQTEANGTAHNNMQPYIIVNRWHRTA